MNKKIKLGLFVFIIIGVVILNFTYKNKTIKTKRQSNLAIMIKGDSGEYVSSNEIPKGNYVLNEEKTICENGGKVVSYNNSTGQIGFSFLGSDRCSLYFDKIIDTQKPVISNLKINGTMVTAILTDNIELSGYGISTSNSTEPTSWTTISGKTYNLSTTISTEGTYYLWVKDGAGNKTTKEFTISLGTPITTLLSTSTPDVYNENGLRYEGTDPNNYICLDNKTSGACSSSSLLFRIIGLFDEEYSTNGTSSSGTKKLLKVIDTNNYGGTDGKKWNSAGTNNWSTASLKTELNGTYLTTLLGSPNVNSKLSNSIANAKWHLGGASSSNYNTLTAEGIYKEERNTSAIYSGNPSSIYAKVGLMYPSDYGYATIGGTNINKSECRTRDLYDWDGSIYSDCRNNDWLFISQNNFVNNVEWTITPRSDTSGNVLHIRSTGNVSHQYNYIDVPNFYWAARPTFYLDSSVLKIVGGTGTSDNAYRIG